MSSLLRMVSLWLLFVAPVHAQEVIDGVAVVPERGPLRPGGTDTVRVAVAGLPLGERPEVTARGGQLRPIDAGRTYLFATDIHATEVAFTVSTSRGDTRVELGVERHPPSALELSVEGTPSAGDDVLRVRVDSADPIPAEAIQVAVSEGGVREVVTTTDGLEVVIEPEDLPFPRVVLVGVRDARGDAAPVWIELPLRARPSLPLRSDPGSVVVVRVGSRRYGPFSADAAGLVTAHIEQYPGEVVATAEFQDELGNRSSADLPLAVQTQSLLVPVVIGEHAVDATPPAVMLRAVQLDGRPWSGERLSCRTPTVDLEVLEIGRGEWLLPLPAGRVEIDRRIECQAGSARRSIRIPVQAGIPARLSLRVWPSQLRTDFPTAEVRVVVEDAEGERLPVEGVEVTAAHGEVAIAPSDDTVLRGEYQGARAIEHGEDVVTAEYFGQPGGPLVRRIDLAWDTPSGSTARVHGRAVDASRQPVPGVLLELQAGAEARTARTGDDGWASAEVPLPPGGGPFVVSARTAHLVHREPVLDGQLGRPGPGVPDLRAESRVHISPGRVVGISVAVEPPTLRAAPGAVAYITVELEDRTGSAVTDEPPVISASMCCVGPGELRRDGSWLYTYTPDPVERERDVTITASIESLRSSTTLDLEPRLVRWSVGPWLGVQTNFGSVTAPVLGADVDLRLRTPYLGESTMVRFGLATWSFDSTAATGLGVRARARSNVFAGSSALLFRHDFGPGGVWGGVGLAIAAHTMDVELGTDPLVSTTTVPYGPMVLAGTSRRAFGGELVLGVRATSLSGIDGEVGISGNIGGVAVGAGYRLIF